MRIVADTHLHLYPCYDLVPALKGLMHSLHIVSDEAIAIGMLAERHDCHFFSAISNGLLDNDFKVEKSKEKSTVVKLTDKDRSLYLYAGRQVISSERIEILAVTTDSEIPDGLPAKAIIDKILGEGAVPVLSWAPGKWFFQRKKVVSDLLQSFSPKQLVIGDTSLRPTIWQEPLLMKRARKQGYSIICGSDPLPFAGEESMMGRYYSTCDTNFDTSNPLRSIRSLLQGSGTVFREGGNRCSLMEVFMRLRKNKQSKHD